MSVASTLERGADAVCCQLALPVGAGGRCSGALDAALYVELGSAGAADETLLAVESALLRSGRVGARVVLFVVLCGAEADAAHCAALVDAVCLFVKRLRARCGAEARALRVAVLAEARVSAALPAVVELAGSPDCATFAEGLGVALLPTAQLLLQSTAGECASADALAVLSRGDVLRYVVGGRTALLGTCLEQYDTSAPVMFTGTFHVPYECTVCFTDDAFAPDDTCLSLAVRQILERGELDAVVTQRRVLFVMEEELVRAGAVSPERVLAYMAGRERLMDFAGFEVRVSAEAVASGGERCKGGLAPVTELCAMLDGHGLDRHSLVVVVGGGAFLDMCGVAAACAHRGINILRMPTTVLAQGDSGVGVKCAVNLFNKKNFFGSFAVPGAVVNSFHFLRTLPQREWVGGLAEIVKVGLVRNYRLFCFLEESAAELVARGEPAMKAVTQTGAREHFQHIVTNGDPFERGSARPLDHGHITAHFLEKISQYAVRHGEAVAVGVALDAVYQYEVGALSQASMLRVISLLRALGLPIYNALLWERRGELCDAREEFRLHIGGKFTALMLFDDATPNTTAPWRMAEVHHIDDDTFVAALARLRDL